MIRPVPGLTSIIIPTYNHAAFLRDAVMSALAQTAPIEVLVIDDGSTDDTPVVLYQGPHALARWKSVRIIQQPHAGVSAARNLGIESAEGEFVMFLDADDLIAPSKVAEQLAAFSDEVGWVLCDTDIRDEQGRSELASVRYRYAHRKLGGWVRDQLAASNFIPVMAPLVRASVLTPEVRFGDDAPEDWHFWYRLAAHARMRYLPRVLGTYRKQRRGRHNLDLVQTRPAGDGPIYLNLGCRTPGALSWHPMPGCVNLDRAMGWMFEDGLPQFATGTVAGITISHALMYAAEKDWRRLFDEFARVLTRGGVIRITEDDTIHPRSTRRGGWKGSEPAITLTSPAFVEAQLRRAGFAVYHHAADTTSLYPDLTLIQAQHGAPPDVFFIEGVKL